MEKGERVTIKRTTFAFGNSTAITIPAGLDIPPKTELSLTIEVQKSHNENKE